MYICKTCGSMFSTALYIKRKWVCPDCGSTNYTEANYCICCHDYFIAAPNEDYCPDCVHNAEDQLRRAVEKWVDPDYIELLRSEHNDIDYIMEGEDG